MRPARKAATEHAGPVAVGLGPGQPAQFRGARNQGEPIFA
jgi:hypothetical protein